MARVPSPLVGAGYRSGESLRQTMGYTESGDICYLVTPPADPHAYTHTPPIRHLTGHPPAVAAFR